MKAPIVNKLLHHCILACVIASLCGCASILGKSKWPVDFHTKPEGAKVVIYDMKGTLLLTGKTPMTVTLKSSSGYFKRARYRIEVTKPGGRPDIGVLEASISGYYYIDWFCGGPIGMLFVDPATGAMWELPGSYETNEERIAREAEYRAYEAKYAASYSGNSGGEALYRNSVQDYQRGVRLQEWRQNQSFQQQIRIQQTYPAFQPTFRR